MTTQIIFEHPLNERMRAFLRLEHLFEKIDYFMPQYDAWATRVAVDALMDIAAVTARADMKSEIQKELDRYIAALNRLASDPAVDTGALERILDELQRARAGLVALDCPIGQAAREDEFLKAISQRSSIPGGACSFDIPQYHHWLIQAPEVRQTRLEAWLTDLKPADRAIRLMLSLARTSANARRITAEGGFFQEALDAQTPAQLVRVGLDADTGLYPVVSGHRTRYSIRFLRVEPKGRASQCQEDIPFRLTCCVF